VKETTEGKVRRIYSTSRVRLQNPDEEGVRLAQSEAEMKAKAQLMKHTDGRKDVRGKLSGVVVRRTCQSGEYIYVTVETSDSLQKASGSLKFQMEESVERTPTPR